jgi:hypothetical protein
MKRGPNSTRWEAHSGGSSGLDASRLRAALGLELLVDTGSGVVRHGRRVCIHRVIELIYKVLCKNLAQIKVVALNKDGRLSNETGGIDSQRQ